MIHVRRDHIQTRLLFDILESLDHHILQLENIDMIKLFEEFDFSKCCNWKAVLLVVHEDLLQRNQFSSAL